MQLQKLITTREGHRRVIQMHMEKFNEELTVQEGKRLIQILAEKLDVIKTLNEKIVNHPDTEDIVEELVQSEENTINIELQLTKMSSRIQERDRGEQPTYENQNHNQRSEESTHTITENSSQVSAHIQSNCHKLPKLTMPSFNGDVTQWQTFWDNYESSIHNNTSLSDVQKFSYLRSLLTDSAASCISGLPLTNTNYSKAVNLLVDRFGQSHKIINSYMQSLLGLQKPRNDYESLQTFNDQLLTYVRGLESLGQHPESYGDLLVPVITEKLPVEIRKNIVREIGNGQIKLDHLIAAIQKEVGVLEAGENEACPNLHTPTALFLTKADKGNYKGYTDERKAAISTVENTIPLCPFCEKTHRASDCTNVTSIEEKFELVKRKRLCYNCLSKKHQVSSCHSHFRCRNCGRKHHTSICDQRSTSSLDPSTREFQPKGPVTTNFHSSATQRQNVLLKTAVAKATNGVFTTDENILFDEGSQRSFITEKTARRLNLEHNGTDSISLASFGGAKQDLQHLPTTTLNILSTDGEKIPLDVMIVPKIAVPLQNVQQDIQSLRYLQGLKLAHPITEEDMFEISILIGADSYWRFVGNHIIRGDGPTAVESRIGYLLSGPLPTKLPINTPKHMLNVITAPLDNDELERFWKLESLGIAHEDEKTQVSYLEQYMEKDIKYSDGRYHAKLPWKEDHPPLPSNYDITKKRTDSLIRRLRKEPQLLQKYGEIIAEQKNRGFIEVVNEQSVPDHPVHYIPHHGVKKDSITTPIRIVYDCSCHQSENEPSLNDCLSSVAPELNDLTGILMRFRTNKYAIATDIEKAFLHVALDSRDRDVTRFLWLSDPADPDSPLMTYRFKAVLFGATCSPFILCATIIKHLESNKANWVSNHLHRDIYVDNIISSFQQESDVLRYYHDTRALMSTANFNLRSWNSNSKTVRENAEKDKVLDNDNISKILGMRWNAEKDVISYPERTIPKQDIVTKRWILQNTSRQYDPLGLLTPVTIKAKLMLQELWQLNYTWDTPLPATLQKRWHDIADDINTVSKNGYMRYLFANKSDGETNQDQNRTIHVFCDASMTSYGAAAYLIEGRKSALLMSKSRVAPLKGLTLPRLELMAAVIGARLTKHVQNELNIENTVLWSDSQIVLHCLQSNKTLPRFVRNRVNEIQNLTNHSPWKYCPTSHNPADLLTRGITGEQFMKSDLWFRGPEWIIDPDRWPTWNQQHTSIHTAYTNVEEQNVNTSACTGKHAITGIHNVIDIERYGQLDKLLRVTAYVLRFIKNCKISRRDGRSYGTLSIEEKIKAENTWVRSCQRCTYNEEMTNIKSHKNTLPIVKQLRLFVDDEDYIRCGGRIQNAELENDTKNPYLLPKTHTFTRLVVQYAHSKLLHSGVSATMTYLRQRYWIPAIRQCVKSTLRKCITCRKVTSKPYPSPVTPPLPTYRVREEPPFSVTGVDFSGALHVKTENGHERKAYICLFTCAITRAVHLEIVTDMTEQSFLQAFRRFTSRRSVPRLMVSDNAKTFYAASNYLHKLFNSETLHNELGNRGVEWKFIPKRAPWFGGWWERLIGLTKTTLKKVLGRSCITLDALQTVITEVESILNDRPLTYTSCDIMDPEPLTPAHLLYGRRLTRLPIESMVLEPKLTDAESLKTKAAGVALAMSHFWNRWKHEYLTALREFHNGDGTKSEQNIQVGDVVQVHDETPRLKWKMAVVDELLPGKDGQTRAVRLRMNNGVSTRPITKLYPLETI